MCLGDSRFEEAPWHSQDSYTGGAASSDKMMEASDLLSVSFISALHPEFSMIRNLGLYYSGNVPHCDSHISQSSPKATLKNESLGQ